MGNAHLLFGFWNRKTLDALREILDSRYPEAVPAVIWQINQALLADIVKIKPVFAPSERACLLFAVVFRPDLFPTLILGDEDVSDLIYNLRNRRSTAVYRFLTNKTDLSYLQHMTTLAFRAPAPT